MEKEIDYRNGKQRKQLPTHRVQKAKETWGCLKLRGGTLKTNPLRRGCFLLVLQELEE